MVAALEPLEVRVASVATLESTVPDSSIPARLRYAETHEWARQDGDTMTVGITDFAQDQLGDIVFVDLLPPGTDLQKGQPFGEVESTKSVSELNAPMAGTIVHRNEELEKRPALVNENPYGEGWMVAIRPGDMNELDSLLDSAGYREHIS